MPGWRAWDQILPSGNLDARESLDYFGGRRTDTNVGNKFQGVETPSQSRYVGYYEAMRSRHGGRAPSPAARVALRRIAIRGMMYVGQGNGDDFWFTVSQGRANPVFSAHLGFRDAIQCCREILPH